MNKIEIGIFKTKPKLLIYKFRLFIGRGKRDLSDPLCDTDIKADLWLEATGWVGIKKFGFKNYFLKSARVLFDQNKITRADGGVIEAENVPEAIQLISKAFHDFLSNSKDLSFKDSKDGR